MSSFTARSVRWGIDALALCAAVVAPVISAGTRRIGARETPLLIDMRAHEEDLVSHLPGAVWVERRAQFRAAAPR